MATVFTKVLVGDCMDLLSEASSSAAGADGPVSATFLDRPFCQGKDYEFFDEARPEDGYWQWMTEICPRVRRDCRRRRPVLHAAGEERRAGAEMSAGDRWSFQNLTVWMKSTSAVPGSRRFGKQYQIVAFGTKGDRPRVFHRQRIGPPLPRATSRRGGTGSTLRIAGMTSASCPRGALPGRRPHGASPVSASTSSRPLWRCWCASSCRRVIRAIS